MHKKYLALNKLHRLACHKNQLTNQPTIHLCQINSYLFIFRSLNQPANQAIYLSMWCFSKFPNYFVQAFKIVVDS